MALDPTSDSAVDFAVDFAAVDYRRATPISSVDTTGQLAADAAVNRLGPNVHRAKAIALERTAQCDLLRHVIGNPFRPYPAPPSWPAPVVKLAESMYAGEDCSFALHDALLEAGHPELAEHLAKEQWHPKGCWIVDLILGKV